MPHNPHVLLFYILYKHSGGLKHTNIFDFKQAYVNVVIIKNSYFHN